MEGFHLSRVRVIIHLSAQTLLTALTLGNSHNLSVFWEARSAWSLVGFLPKPCLTAAGVHFDR